MYDLGSVTSPASSNFKAITFVGYEGTFNPTAVIKYEQTQLKSSRLVNAGPHGGKMMCGYNHRPAPTPVSASGSPPARSARSSSSSARRR